MSNESNSKSVDYIFNADCHGLNSVVPWDKNVFNMLKISCHANPQRFPVYGTIPLTQDVHDNLQDMLKDKEGKIVALMAIKGAKYNLPVDGLKQQLSNMERIPNDSLDPYWCDPDITERLNKIAKHLLAEVDSK